MQARGQIHISLLTGWKDSCLDGAGKKTTLPFQESNTSTQAVVIPTQLTRVAELLNSGYAKVPENPNM
jgi:hypothetical protein